MNEIRVDFFKNGKDYDIFLSKKLPIKPSKGDIIMINNFIDEEDKRNILPEEYNKFYNDSIDGSLEFVCKSTTISKDENGIFIEVLVFVKEIN